MIGLFERTLSYFLLLLVVALSPVAVQAQQKDDNLAAALQEARNAGVLETTVDRLLALGYEKQVEPSTMGNFLAILTQCRQENLPLQPFLSKIEEGITKKVPTTRIEEVLRNKLEDYRFTRSLIEKFLKRHDQAESIAPEYLVRIAETLYCGVSRQDLTKLLGEFPLVPLPVVAKGAEILASLRQIRFDPKLSEQIVDSGVRHGYFTAAQRDFARIIAVAEEKGLKDEQIAVVALKVIEKGESQADFLAQLGIGAEDLERRGPQLGDSRPGWAKHMNQVSDGASGKGREAAPSRGGEQAASGSPTAKASSTTPSRGGEQVGPVSTPGSASATTPSASATTPSASASTPSASASTPSASASTPSGSASTPGSAPGGGSGSATSSQLGEAEPPHTKKPLRFAAAGVVASIRPAHATMTLEIEKASRILKGRIGETVKFVISDSVKVKSEGSEPGVFDLDLSEIKAKESYVRVLGKKLAGRVYLITHIVVSMNGEAEAQEEEAIEFTALGSATLIDPPGLTLTLRIENADGVLDGRTGETVTFGVREDVQIKAESPTASLFGLTLDDLQAEEGYLKVLGKELAAGDYLITHIEIALDE